MDCGRSHPWQRLIFSSTRSQARRFLLRRSRIAALRSLRAGSRLAFSLFQNRGARGESDLLQLWIVRHRADTDAGNRKKRLTVFEGREGHAEGGEICLRQFDAPVVTHPVGEIGFLVRSSVLEPRSGL